MKKIILALALALGIASFAQAQEPLTTTPTAKQTTALTRGMTKHNTGACASVGLPPSCTQAQARAAWLAAENAKICTPLGLPGSCTEAEARTQWCAMLGFPGASSCLHADGRGSHQIVFATSAPIDIFSSLANFWDRRAVKTVLDEYVRKADEEDAASIAAAEAALKTGGTKAEKDAYCAAIKKPAGCLP